MIDSPKLTIVKSEFLAQLDLFHTHTQSDELQRDVRIRPRLFDSVLLTVYQEHCASKGNEIVPPLVAIPELSNNDTFTVLHVDPQIIFDIVFEQIPHLGSEALLASLLEKHQVTFVVDHYIQAEKISRIAQLVEQSVAQSVSCLIAIQGKRAGSGIRAGAAAIELARGVSTLPHLNWKGFLFRDVNQASTASHCLESVQRLIPELKTSSFQLVLSDDFSSSMPAPFTEYWKSPFREHAVRASITATVISRPNLNCAVINLGSKHFRSAVRDSSPPEGFNRWGLIEWRLVGKEDDWHVFPCQSVFEQQMFEYELVIPLDDSTPNIQIGSEIEVRLQSPETCLLPMQFV